MPHHGHFECVIKHVCGYLAKMKDTVLWVQIAEPNYYSGLPDHEYDWERSVSSGKYFASYLDFVRIAHLLSAIVCALTKIGACCAHPLKPPLRMCRIRRKTLLQAFCVFAFLYF
jgi:hypothetical protein